MDRQQKAYECFKEGYNCAQAVIMAFSDVLPIDEQLLLKISSAFGGGFARTRNLCGAVAGIGMVLGVLKDSLGNVAEDKKDIYERSGVEEYWIVSPQGAVEIYYLENGKYVLNQSYLLQNDKEDEEYNAEQEICLKSFPNIKMTLGEIFAGLE